MRTCATSSGRRFTDMYTSSFYDFRHKRGKVATLARINRDYTEKQATVRSFIPFRENIDNIIRVH